MGLSTIDKKLDNHNTRKEIAKYLGWSTQQSIADVMDIKQKQVSRIINSHYSTRGKKTKDFKPFLYNIWNTQQKIADDLDKDKSTISRIIKNLLKISTDGKIGQDFKPYLIFLEICPQLEKFLKNSTAGNIEENWNTQQSIADVMDVSQDTIKNIINNENSTCGKIVKDFKPFIYNIWNIHKADIMEVDKASVSRIIKLQICPQMEKFAKISNHSFITFGTSTKQTKRLRDKMSRSYQQFKW